VIGQICFFAFVGISIALHPGFVFKSNEGGISNYGIHVKTFVPFSLGFLLCSACSALAARRRRGDVLAVALYIYAVLLILTLASTFPYKVNSTFKEIHVIVGIAIVVFELVASLVLTWWARSWSLVPFLVLSVVGFVVAGLTFLGAFHLLFLGQALLSVGIAGVLILTATKENGEVPQSTPAR